MTVAPAYYSREEIAKRLRCSKRRVSYLAHVKGLPVAKRGQQWFITEEALSEWEREQYEKEKIQKIRKEAYV